MTDRELIVSRRDDDRGARFGCRARRIEILCDRPRGAPDRAEAVEGPVASPEELLPPGREDGLDEGAARHLRAVARHHDEGRPR